MKKLIFVFLIFFVVGCGGKRDTAYEMTPDTMKRYVDKELNIVCYRSFYGGGLSCIKLGP